VIRQAFDTLRLLHEARRSSRRPAAWFRRRQEVTLRRLLRHAYEKVPLYRRHFDEAGFHPDAFRGLADLDRIPPLTKARLKDADLVEAVAVGTDPASCSIVTTSGSTGVPMRIVLGHHERCWHRAVAWRILFEHGFRWTDRTLEVRMQPEQRYAIQRLGIAPKDWLTILDSPEVWAECLARNGHACVVAGAGTLDALAGAVASRPIRAPRLVVSDSEPLTPTSRSRIATALGTDPVDVYGLVEVSNFAWECERRCGLHVSADSHLVEVQAPPGEIGPLLVTALGMWTMPIIRYQTGDLAEASVSPCPCGRSLPLLAAVRGRAIDSIEIPGGRRLLWPYFHEILGSEPGIREWQVMQVTESDIVVKVVVGTSVSAVTATIGALLRSRLPRELTIQVYAVESIPVEGNGKRRLIIPFRP